MRRGARISEWSVLLLRYTWDVRIISFWNNNISHISLSTHEQCFDFLFVLFCSFHLTVSAVVNGDYGVLV